MAFHTMMLVSAATTSRRYPRPATTWTLLRIKQLKHDHNNSTYQLTFPRLQLRTKRRMRKHAPRTTFGVAMPSRLPGTSFLKKGNEWHDGNALGSRRRIEWIVAATRVENGILFNLFATHWRTKRNGGWKDTVIDRFTLGRRRLLFGLFRLSWKVDSLFKETTSGLE
jgi:hypothetical protein